MTMNIASLHLSIQYGSSFSTYYSHNTCYVTWCRFLLFTLWVKQQENFIEFTILHYSSGFHRERLDVDPKVPARSTTPLFIYRFMTIKRSTWRRTNCLQSSKTGLCRGQIWGMQQNNILLHSRSSRDNSLMEQPGLFPVLLVSSGDPKRMTLDCV